MLLGELFFDQTYPCRYRSPFLRVSLGNTVLIFLLTPRQRKRVVGDKWQAYYTLFFSTVASAMNMNRSPIATPRPNMGMKLAIVAFIDTSPADAELPTKLMPATTGSTMTMTTSAMMT